MFREEEQRQRQRQRQQQHESTVIRLLPEAVSIVFDSLCDGAKNAVLIQLKHRYALTLDSPGITVEKLSVAIIDIFGIDGGQMLTEKIWLTIEEMIASEALRKRRSHIIQSGRNDK